MVNIMPEILLGKVITGNPMALKHWRRCSQRTSHSPEIQGWLGRKLCKATGQQSHHRKTNFHGLLQHTLSVLISQWGKNLLFHSYISDIEFFFNSTDPSLWKPSELTLDFSGQALDTSKISLLSSSPSKQAVTWVSFITYEVWGHMLQSLLAPPSVTAAWKPSSMIQNTSWLSAQLFSLPKALLYIDWVQSRPCNPAWSVKAASFLDPAWWACFKNFLNIVGKRMRDGERQFSMTMFVLIIYSLEVDIGAYIFH